MATLLFYDFLLTLWVIPFTADHLAPLTIESRLNSVYILFPSGEEVEYVWKTKPRISVAKALWFLVRCHLLGSSLYSTLFHLDVARVRRRIDTGP